MSQPNILGSIPKDYRAAVKRAVKDGGWHLELPRHGHARLVHETGEYVVMPGTSNSASGYHNFLARLRRVERGVSAKSRH